MSRACWGEFVTWTHQDGFDCLLADARMLGQDFHGKFDAQARAPIAGIVALRARVGGVATPGAAAGPAQRG